MKLNNKQTIIVFNQCFNQYLGFNYKYYSSLITFHSWINFTFSKTTSCMHGSQNWCSLLPVWKQIILDDFGAGKYYTFFVYFNPIFKKFKHLFGYIKTSRAKKSQTRFELIMNILKTLRPCSTRSETKKSHFPDCIRLGIEAMKSLVSCRLKKNSVRRQTLKTPHAPML